MFKHEVCAKVKSWHPLAFVADIKVNSSAHITTGKFSTRDYHSVLKVIFQSVAAVQSAGAFHHTLCIDDSYFDVKVKHPIAVIIGDAKRNNSLPVLIVTSNFANVGESKRKIHAQNVAITLMIVMLLHFLEK